MYYSFFQTEIWQSKDIDLDKLGVVESPNVFMGEIQRVTTVDVSPKKYLFVCVIQFIVISHLKCDI